MKKLIVIAAAVAFVSFGVQVMASPPVEPPKEGFVISTTTDIECLGTMEESESYNTTYFAGATGDGPNSLAPATGGAFNRGAEVAYEQDFKAIDGLTRFVKDFDADSHDAPNLEVSKAIGYVADPASSAAVATHEEKVGLSVVAAGDDGVNFSGLLSLCPWVTTTTYPATNEGIAAGNSFKVTAIDGFTSDSEVISTEIPKLTHEVDATNDEGGFAGIGEISAAFVVELFEGDSQFDGENVPGIQSRTTYEEFASASGVWNFSKDMEYQSTFPSLGLANPFNRVP